MAYRSRILSVGPGGGIRTPCSARSLNIQQSPGFGAPVEIAGVSPWGCLPASRRLLVREHRQGRNRTICNLAVAGSVPGHGDLVRNLRGKEFMTGGTGRQRCPGSIGFHPGACPPGPAILVAAPPSGCAGVSARPEQWTTSDSMQWRHARCPGRACQRQRTTQS